MASSVGAGRTRTVLWTLFALGVLVFALDGGSCAIARMQVDGDAKTAGRFAVQQIQGMPVNQETAKIAYQSAVEALPNKKMTVAQQLPGEDRDFRVHADGAITMTVQREAPTLVFKYLPKLKDLTSAEVTYTQQPLGM